MDKGSAIIVFVIVALIALPFIFHSLYKKKKDLRFLKDFQNLAEKEKIVISQKELWNHCYAIAIDSNSRKIFYANKRKDNVECILIDLTDVSKCRIAKINKTTKNQDGENSISDRLELIFTFRKSDIPEKSLEFYDSSEFMPTDKENSIIENWQNIINSSLINSRE